MEVSRKTWCWHCGDGAMIRATEYHKDGLVLSRYLCPTCGANTEIVLSIGGQLGTKKKPAVKGILGYPTYIDPDGRIINSAY